MKKIECLLREKTCGLFSDKWYDDVVFCIDKELNKDLKGYVYFIKSNLTGLYKIGIAKNIMNRLNSLRHSNGSIHLIGYIYSESYKDLEKEIHLHFNAHRSYGEWFKLSLDHCINEINNQKGLLINHGFSPKIKIEDGEFIPEFNNVTENDVLTSSVLQYIREKITIGEVYDSKDVYIDMSMKDLSQKKMTMIIMNYAKDYGLKYKSIRTHNARKFCLEA